MNQTIKKSYFLNKTHYIVCYYYGYDAQVPEDSPVGYSVGSVAATDGDYGTDGDVVYSITGIEHVHIDMKHTNGMANTIYMYLMV